jgi:dienelactone hydrolase
MLQEKEIEYQANDVTLKGYYVFDNAIMEKRPGVLVAHDWSGRNQFACDKAKKMAELGLVGFALDLYGNAEVFESKEEKMAHMKPLMENRKLLARRMLCALDTIKKLEPVDKKRIGAIGFCFGGLAVLDLARSGADIRGVVSVHGLLSPPSDKNSVKIKAKILALHGHKDPMVTVDQVMGFQAEMTDACADWQMHIYSNAMHAFTNPLANDPNFGTVFDPMADQRSSIAIKDFLAEIFSSA